MTPKPVPAGAAAAAQPAVNAAGVPVVVLGGLLPLACAYILTRLLCTYITVYVCQTVSCQLCRCHSAPGSDVTQATTTVNQYAFCLFSPSTRKACEQL